MAALSTQAITQSGIKPTFAAASAGGDTFTHGKKVYFYIKNDDASPHTATLVSQFSAVPSVGPVNLDIVVPAGEERVAGPFSDNFKDGNGDVNITYDAVTSVSVAVLQSA